MVSKNKRELGRRAFATLAGAVLAAPHVRAETATDIRIGFANIGADNRQFSAGSTAAVAHAEGYVERELRDLPGVQVHWYFFKGAGPAVNEAFATGQLDIAFEGDLPEVIGRASGLRTRHLMASGGHGPTYLAVPPESPLTGIDSLRGKKIGLFRGTNNHLAVVKVLAAHGMTERDMQVFNMDEATSNAALVARDIDAAFGNYGPLDLAARGLAKIIYTTKGDNPAFVRAADFASQEKNRDAVFDIWARSGRSAQIFREDCAGQTMQYRCSPLLDDFMVEQYRVQAQQARQYGLIRRDVDVQGWFDTHFLDTALQTLGLQNAWVRYDKNGKPVAAT
jgi:sulfonate transport system substrate-binding protein